MIDGPNKYHSILKVQNEYLFNIITFPIHDTNEEEMKLIAPELLKHKSVTRVIRTMKSEKSERWLVESTKKLEKQAKHLVDKTLIELEEQLEGLRTYDNKPNISLTSWGATNISTLVKDTTVENPDKKSMETKANAWNKPPRVVRMNMSYTFEKVEYNSILKPKNTKDSTTTNVVKNTETATKTAPYNPMDNSLLNDIKYLKKDILDQCSKLIEEKINNVIEMQQDHGQLMLQYKTDHQQDHKMVVDMIKELTESVKSLSAMLNFDAQTSLIGKPHEAKEGEKPMVTPMQIEKKQHKRKEGYNLVSNTHRKTRSKSTLE